MKPDTLELYRLMLSSRLYEEGIALLWNHGLISGEMHLGTGEEAIMAGIISQLQPGDALALDHRGTSALLMAGVDPKLIIRELLGRPDGLCSGKGGHMHLFSKEHLAASSGIVGASGPAAVGFALAAQYLRPETVAIAFFGEGAMNQGMLLESFNLASIWNLPVIFVCKDDQWSITTTSKSMTGGDLCDRARGLGVEAHSVDGTDIEAVWQTAAQAFKKARSGQGPSFIWASCIHITGHFLGYPLIRTIRKPIREFPRMVFPLLRSFFQTGTGLRKRLAGFAAVSQALIATAKDIRNATNNDPLLRTRSLLEVDTDYLKKMESDIKQQVRSTIASAKEGGSL